MVQDASRAFVFRKSVIFFASMRLFAQLLSWLTRVNPIDEDVFTCIYHNSLTDVTTNLAIINQL